MLVQSFPSLHEAQAFLAGAKLTPDTSSNGHRSEPQKFYAVQSGRVPGVYTDWPSAQAQIIGWVRPKHRKFSTRSEAEDFVKAGQQSQAASAEPSENKEDSIVPMSSKSEPQGNEAKRPKTSPTGISALADNTLKDIDGVAFEPGTGPFPPGAEDGFDPNILLDPKTGKVIYKTEAQKKATKMQAKRPSPAGMLKIYTDGSSLRNGAAGAVAGVGVYFGDGDPRSAFPFLFSDTRFLHTHILHAAETFPNP